MLALNLFSYLELCLIRTVRELSFNLIDIASFIRDRRAGISIRIPEINQLSLKANRNDFVTRCENPAGESVEKYGFPSSRDLRGTLYIGPGRDSREVLSSTRIYLHPAVEEVNEGSRFTRPPQVIPPRSCNKAAIIKRSM